jgi:hypothetical protein
MSPAAKEFYRILLDGRVLHGENPILNWMAGNVQVKAYVKNLSNADNKTNIIIEDALIGSYRNVRLLDPRTLGVQLEYRF